MKNLVATNKLSLEKNSEKPSLPILDQLDAVLSGFSTSIGAAVNQACVTSQPGPSGVQQQQTVPPKRHASDQAYVRIDLTKSLSPKHSNSSSRVSRSSKGVSKRQNTNRKGKDLAVLMKYQQQQPPQHKGQQLQQHQSFQAPQQQLIQQQPPLQTQQPQHLQAPQQQEQQLQAPQHHQVPQQELPVQVPQQQQQQLQVQVPQQQQQLQVQVPQQQQQLQVQVPQQPQQLQVQAPQQNLQAPQQQQLLAPQEQQLLPLQQQQQRNMEQMQEEQEQLYINVTPAMSPILREFPRQHQQLQRFLVPQQQPLLMQQQPEMQQPFYVASPPPPMTPIIQQAPRQRQHRQEQDYQQIVLPPLESLTAGVVTRVQGALREQRPRLQRLVDRLWAEYNRFNDELNSLDRFLAYLPEN